MRLQKPDNNDALHVIVWNPHYQRWYSIGDSQCKRIALKVSIIEAEIENGVDNSVGSNNAREALTGIDRASTALINLHNILKRAWTQWEDLCAGIDTKIN